MRIVRSYLRNVIDLALQKVIHSHQRIDNDVFITTAEITQQVRDYAARLYHRTGGIEFAVLDCISFIRHFLHLFQRIRIDFLAAYQQLLLDEPDSSVRPELKEAFLRLRRAALNTGDPEDRAES